MIKDRQFNVYKKHEITDQIVEQIKSTIKKYILQNNELVFMIFSGKINCLIKLNDVNL